MLASKHKDLALTPKCYHTYSAQSYLLAMSKHIVCSKFIFFLDQWLISLPNNWRCLEIQWLFLGITRTEVGGHQLLMEQGGSQAPTKYTTESTTKRR